MTSNQLRAWFLSTLYYPTDCTVSDESLIADYETKLAQDRELIEQREQNDSDTITRLSLDVDRSRRDQARVELSRWMALAVEAAEVNGEGIGADPVAYVRSKLGLPRPNAA